MAVSKVAYDGHTLIDLTGDTATAADVATGKKFHLANGEQATGTNTGGITPTGTINISTNGDHDVTSYATAHVTVDTAYAVFPHAVDLAIDVIDGSYQINPSLTCRAHDEVNTNQVTWDNITPEEHKEEGYYSWTSTILLAGGSEKDGFYITVDDAFMIVGSVSYQYIEIAHTGGRRKYYIFVPHNVNTLTVTFTP